MEHLSVYVYVVFGLTVLLAIRLFYKAANYSKPLLAVILLWAAFQSAMGLSGFYKLDNTLPPRFALLVAPPMLAIISCFSTAKGRAFTDGLDIKALTLLHIIRIPVEVVLYWLCLHKAVPALMTFEGRNFDILSGLSAPVVYYSGFVKRRMGRAALLVWNIICLGLLINIVVNAILSVPNRLQHFAFSQPNIALGYFPFVLLPSCLVPMVLLAHLVAIRRLARGGM